MYNKIYLTIKQLLLEYIDINMAWYHIYLIISCEYVIFKFKTKLFYQFSHDTYFSSILMYPTKPISSPFNVVKTSNQLAANISAIYSAFCDVLATDHKWHKYI